MIEIRPVFVADAETLSEVAIRAYSDHYRHFWTDGGEWYLERSFSPDNLRAELADRGNRFYLAVFEGRAGRIFENQTRQFSSGL
ncbi:MAG: hypothetical protein R2747_15075 [Pyrinomonadaceae bacterium]